MVREVDGISLGSLFLIRGQPLSDQRKLTGRRRASSIVYVLCWVVNLRSHASSAGFHSACPGIQMCSSSRSAQSWKKNKKVTQQFHDFSSYFCILC